MLKSLAEHYKFDVEAPWASLSPNVHKVILFGSGKENIEFKYMNDRGDTSVRRHPFEGCCTTWSAATKRPNPARCARSWRSLSATAPAPPVRARVCVAKRATCLSKTALPTISDMSIGHAMDFFNNLKLSGQRAKIAEKVLKEIGDRLKFR